MYDGNRIYHVYSYFTEKKKYIFCVLHSHVVPIESFCNKDLYKSSFFKLFIQRILDKVSQFPKKS